MIKLKYGNTNTFYISGNNCGLLLDTDYAGTLHAFYKTLKKNGIDTKAVSCVLATHYHPDHMGLISDFMNQGVKLLLVDVQKPYIHFSDAVFEKDKLPYLPINAASAIVITCEESRSFLEKWVSSVKYSTLQVTVKTAFLLYWTMAIALSEILNRSSIWRHTKIMNH